ncbi:MAG TPA: class I SAM-dependent methyltransferase [Prosthecobacter sp.]
MSFDTLAPHYRWMEWLFAGEKLQRCRTAFLPSVPAPSHALLYGEGNGRFLSAFCRQFPTAQVTVVDFSAGMIQQARLHLEAAGIDTTNVTFVEANVLEWQPPEQAFDLIVTCFFLDCFREDDLKTLVGHLARAATPQAHWLQADFQIGGPLLCRWRSRLTLHFLYFFFRHAARIRATRLTRPESLLAQAGFILQKRRLSDWRRLGSEWWARPDAGLPS